MCTRVYSNQNGTACTDPEKHWLRECAFINVVAFSLPIIDQNRMYSWIGFVLLSQKFSIRLERCALDRSSTLFEFGPQIIMRLLLMVVNGAFVLVQFVKKEFRRIVLRSKHIKTNASRLLARLDRVGFNHFQKFVHTVGVNLGLNDDRKRFAVFGVEAGAGS